MKNAHIKPGELVPAEIRLEVYKEALAILKDNEALAILKDNEYRYLCVMLPMLLWDLEHPGYFAPCGDYWSSIDTPSMFPEIAEGVKKIQASAFNRRPVIRIETIQSAIEQLEKQLNKKALV